MTEPVPVRNEISLSLSLVLLVAAVTVFGLVQAAVSSLWWLALPLVAYGVLAAEFWWQVRRDPQLARIVDLDELDNGVDLSLIDLHRWADAGDDPRWRCGPEDDTGEKR